MFFKSGFIPRAVPENGVSGKRLCWPASKVELIDMDRLYSSCRAKIWSKCNSEWCHKEVMAFGRDDGMLSVYDLCVTSVIRLLLIAAILFLQVLCVITAIALYFIFDFYL